MPPHQQAVAVPLSSAEKQAGVGVQVLWWLVPPLVATAVAMAWAAWAGRARDDVRRDNSDAALLRMRQALSRPEPQNAQRAAPPPLEPTHGVAVRRTRRASSALSRR